MSSILRKIHAHLTAAQALGSANLRGFPGLPKMLFKALPYNREQFNQFVAWIQRLQLDGAHCILDIGANHGDFSEAASAMFPNANLWLFEPLPVLHPELKERAERHRGHWTVCQYALGSSSATLDLHVDPSRDDIASLVGFDKTYSDNARAGHEVTKSTCQVIPLDDLLPTFPSSGIDLMKIDVEGFEFEVLEGGMKALSRTKAMIIEVSLMRATDREGSRLTRMLASLEASGLFPVEILPSWFSAHDPWLPVEFNILARRIH